MRLTNLWPSAWLERRQPAGRQPSNNAVSDGSRNVFTSNQPGASATAANAFGTAPRPTAPGVARPTTGSGFPGLMSQVTGMDEASQVAFFSKMLRAWSHKSLVKLSQDLAHADAMAAQGEEGCELVARTYERFESAEWSHKVAQHADPKMYPQITAQFQAILEGIRTGNAPWRPRGHDKERVLTREHVEDADVNLLTTTAGVALAMQLPTVLASEGQRCGLDLYDEAWEAAEARPGSKWASLAARARKWSPDGSLEQLAARVAYVVETSAFGTWGSNPLVTDLAHEVLQEVSRLPRQEVLACLTASLQRSGAADEPKVAIAHPPA